MEDDIPDPLDEDLEEKASYGTQKCPHCQSRVWEEAQDCPHCGESMEKTGFWRHPWWFIALGLAGVAAVILTLV